MYSKNAVRRKRKSRKHHPETESTVTHHPHTHPAIDLARRDPASLSTDDIIQLQRTIGNQAVIRLLSVGDTIQTGRSREFRRMPVAAQGAAITLGATIPDKETAKSIYKSNQRLMSQAEMDAIQTISQSAAGKAWLMKKGFLTFDEMIKYAISAQGRDFSKWEGMSMAKRLQVATFAWQMKQRGTPGYWKGLSVHKKTDEIYANDANMWEATLQGPDLAAKQRVTQVMQGDTGAATAAMQRADSAVAIVRRLFIILQQGLKYLDSNDVYQPWQEEVAVALSHGGRVSIRIPKVQDGSNPHALFNWLTGSQSFHNLNVESGLHKRTAGTHYLDISSDGKFKEKRGYGAARQAHFDRSYSHFGLDLPVGGMGNLDLNGNVVLADGSYGHLYIGYKPPSTTRDGGLLIGCETDAPGKTNALGHKHTAKATSAEFSSTGGSKADKISGKDTGMMVDLRAVDTSLMDKLQDIEDMITQGLIESRDLVGSNANFPG